MNPLPINAIKPIAGIPQIWQADELAASQGQTVPTGDALLNAQLPGGGWPVGALVEVLQAHSGHNDWRLLLPALVKTEGVLVLVGAPHAPFAPGLAGQGLDPVRLLCVNTPTPAARMWAAEQALRCKDVAAVLAWLPQARADSLRRLQISAAEHRKLLFVMRPARAQHESSPAVLRVITSNPMVANPMVMDPVMANPTALNQVSSDQAASNVLLGDALLVHIFKRRGPPLEQALTLVARPVRLGALLALRGTARPGKRRSEPVEPLGKTPFSAAFDASPAESMVSGLASGFVSGLATGLATEWSAEGAAGGSAELLDFPHKPQEHSHALDRAAA